MKPARNILIAGFGDIGRRVAQRLRGTRHYRVTALSRKTGDIPLSGKFVRSARVQLLRGDLGNLRSLQKLNGLADTILHFAPPPGTGKSDPHTKHLLAAISADPTPSRRGSQQKLDARPGMLPRRFVYISTTGVYGNCDGEWIDETRPTRPESSRAKRRVDAERRLQRWGRCNGVSITILRVPGIYAHDRLPLDRLRRQTPVLTPPDDVFTNHIHADDLAAAVISAIRQRRPKQYRIFNAVDDSQLRMGDYFDQVADAFGLNRPPRISRLHAEGQMSPTLLSFMRESRRINNARIKRELKVVLKYPTVASVLSGLHPATQATRD